MKRALVLVTLVTGLSISTIAAADSKLLVLHSEGKADVRTRARVDGAIMKLAKSGKDTVQPSEITYSDAAAMVGCKPDEATCRDEVLATLGVDELLIVNVNPKPPGFEVAIRRAGKGGAIRELSTVTDSPDKIDALGPMFGLKAPVGPVGPTPPVTNPPVGPNPPVTNPPVTNPPAIGPSKPPVDNPPVTNPPVTNPPVTNPPVDNVDHTPIGTPEPKPQPPVVTDQQPKDHHRLYLAGMGGGGGMMFLGIVLWAAASSTQGQIDDAPTKTKADIRHLQDLENRGDSLAGWGNVFAVTGLVVAGVSTYFYIKNKRSHSSKEKTEKTTTVLAPTVFDHGAGVTLSIGGFR